MSIMFNKHPTQYLGPAKTGWILRKAFCFAGERFLCEIIRVQGKIAVYGNITEITRMAKFTKFEKSTRKTSGVGLNYPRENMCFA